MKVFCITLFAWLILSISISFVLAFWTEDGVEQTPDLVLNPMGEALDVNYQTLENVGNLSIDTNLSVGSVITGGTIIVRGEAIFGALSAETTWTKLTASSDVDLKEYAITNGGALYLIEVSAPGTPPTNTVVFYIDAADGYFKIKDDNGEALTIGTFTLD